MNRRTLLAAIPGILVAACAPAPAPVAQSKTDPSNPRAPEGATPPPAHAHGPMASAASYVCPMHPEVVSSQPGVCPKCNMHLVPAK